MQGNLFPPTSRWVPPTELPDLRGAPYTCLDVETYDPHLLDRGSGWATGQGHVAGFALAAPGAPSVYLPMRHRAGGNLPVEGVRRYMADLLRSGTPILCHNALYDIGWLHQEGLPMPTKVIDTMFAGPLLNELRFSYSLDSLCKDYGLPGKDVALLEEAQRAFGDAPIAHLHSKYVGPYATRDAEATVALWEKLRPKIAEEELNTVFDLECDLIPMLTLMRAKGVRVDEEKAARDKEMLKKTLREQQLKLRSEAGFDVNVKSNPHMIRLFEKLKLPHHGTFDKEVLSGVNHPVIDIVQDIRKRRTTISLIIEGMIEKFAVNGRLHAEFSPLRREKDGGTVSGRFSSSGPNLQQVTARDSEFGPMCRSYFLPEKGERWNKNDYSQQEYRDLVHLAVVLNARGGAEAAAFYQDPEADFHAYAAQLLNRPRGEAKNLNFGIVYTMGAEKLAKRLRTTVAAAEALLAKYHAALPFVKILTKKAAEQASKLGYIRTALGRRRRFNAWVPADGKKHRPRMREDAERAWPGQRLQRASTHKALNARIQGDGADMIKLAMREMWRTKRLPTLPVHDELNFSLAKEGADQEVRAINTIMRNALPLRVPMRVDSSIGKDWWNQEKAA